MSAGSAIAIVASGDHLLGAGVLVNAWVRRGLVGTVTIFGDPGARPRWIPESRAPVSPGVVLGWEEIPAGRSPAWHKPEALRRLAAMEPAAERLVLMDADLVPTGAPWSAVETWIDGGVAAFRDLQGDGELDARHPLRLRWAAWLTNQGLPVRRPGGPYVNSGFLGIRREHLPLVDRWAALLGRLESAGVPTSLRLDAEDPRRWGAGPGIRFGDQDALNLALMTGEEPLSLQEGSAMGLGRGGEWFVHPVEGGKPWRLKPWSEAWRGTPPDEATRRFWSEAGGVLDVFPPGLVARRRAALPGAFALTRFPLGIKVLPRAILGLLAERREGPP